MKKDATVIEEKMYEREKNIPKPEDSFRGLPFNSLCPPLTLWGGGVLPFGGGQAEGWGCGQRVYRLLSRERKWPPKEGGLEVPDLVVWSLGGCIGCGGLEAGGRCAYCVSLTPEQNAVGPNEPIGAGVRWARPALG